jgi:RNA-directed DNA polymerase
VYIPKASNPDEQRGLGIPVMADRACQALVKLVLEPEWEAQFEANSYGFRPGRGAHDAIQALWQNIYRKPKYVYDADIAHCFDKINHTVLLDKLSTIRSIHCLVRDWLKAGILDDGEWLFPEAGTPQGGVISPLLANIALHGLESAVGQVSRQYRVVVIRYADDFVMLCEDLATLKAGIERAKTWLSTIGLEIKAAKTRLTHTLDAYEDQVGFDFLGFTIRQYPVGQYRLKTYRGEAGYRTLTQPSRRAIQRQQQKIKQVIRQHRGAPQRALISRLNPIIRGWANYYRMGTAKAVYSAMDKYVHDELMRWARWRHSDKTPGWCRRRYWKQHGGRLVFGDGKYVLGYYRDVAIRRHIKVRGDKSPYDGDWVYWSARLGREYGKPRWLTAKLKQQQGRCAYCGLYLRTEDVIEVHHRDHNRENYQRANLALIHGHCHDQVHGKQYQ